MVRTITVPRISVFLDRVDVALSPEHMTRPPPEAPPCTAPCAPPITPPSPGPGTPGWDREVVCIQPSRTTSPPESLEHPPEEPRNVSARKLTATPLEYRYQMRFHTHQILHWGNTHNKINVNVWFSACCPQRSRSRGLFAELHTHILKQHKHMTQSLWSQVHLQALALCFQHPKNCFHCIPFLYVSGVPLLTERKE